MSLNFTSQSRDQHRFTISEAGAQTRESRQRSYFHQILEWVMRKAPIYT